jgi:pantoate--beta-alanine ligase
MTMSPTRSVGACPTVREGDGLAMSSRNARLSATERSASPRLAEMLLEMARRLSCEYYIDRALEEARQAILAAGFSQIE